MSLLRIPPTLHIHSALGRQVLFLIVGDGITFVALFITAIVLSRIISKEDIATYWQVLFIGPFVVSLADLGLSGAVYRFIPFYPKERQKIFLRNTFIATLALAALASLVLLGLATVVPHLFHNQALSRALLITSAYPFAVMPFSLVRPILICKGHALRATLLEAFFAIVTSLAIILSLNVGFTLNTGLVFWMLANLFRLPTAAWFVSQESRGHHPGGAASIIRDTWAFCWPIKVSQLPSVVMQYFDKVVASAIFPTEVFATYSLGARELPFINSIPMSLSSVLIPQMVEAFQAGKAERVCDLWRKASLSVALLIYPFAAFTICHAKPIIRILFTPAYDDAAIPFGLFAGITFLRVVEYGSLAKALGDTRIIMKATIFGMLFSISISSIMAYFWNIWGISISLLLSTLAIIIYYLNNYRKMINRPVADFFPVLSLLVIGGIALTASTISMAAFNLWIFNEAQGSSLTLATQLSITFMLSSLLYASGLFLLKLIRPHFYSGLNIPFLSTLKKKPTVSKSLP